MSLSERRPNAPTFMDPLPVFQVETPNRTVHRLVRLPSTDSLASFSTTDSRSTLPQYVAEEDHNPDVITTSIEIDPDDEADETELTSSTTTTKTPPASIPVLLPATEKKSKSGNKLAKLFSRTCLLSEKTPGVRLTQTPRILKSIVRDPRQGFPLAMPIVEGRPVLDVDRATYMHLMSRINILLATGALNDVSLLLDSIPALRDRVSFVKAAETKGQDYEVIQSHELVQSGTEATILLTIPELDPRDESDEEASLYSTDRRGSIASLSSATSSRSSFSQRIRFKLERKEEWCLIFE